MRRVVITGAGTINALAHYVDGTYKAFREGRCGIGPLDIRDVDRLSVKIGAQVRGFDETGYFDRQQIRLYDRFTQFAMTAARQAMQQSGMDIRDELADRAGVVL